MSAVGGHVFVFGGVGALGGVLADLWSFRAADAAAGRVHWALRTASDLARSGAGAAPPPRWGHTAWLSGAGEMVLALTLTLTLTPHPHPSPNPNPNPNPYPNPNPDPDPDH